MVEALGPLPLPAFILSILASMKGCRSNCQGLTL